VWKRWQRHLRHFAEGLYAEVRIDFAWEVHDAVFHDHAGAIQFARVGRQVAGERAHVLRHLCSEAQSSQRDQNGARWR